jgi:hypothetical protein
MQEKYKTLDKKLESMWLHTLARDLRRAQHTGVSLLLTHTKLTRLRETHDKKTG